MDEGEEGEVSEEIANDDRDESETDGCSTEFPLFVDWFEGFEECEDEGVGEAGEKGEAEHNRFADKHFERTGPDDENSLDGEALFKWFEFIGAIDVGFTSFTPLFGEVVEHDCGACLRDKEKVEELDDAAEDQLDPEVPMPGAMSLYEGTDERSEG